MTKKKFKDTTVGKVISSLSTTADSILTGGKLSGVINSILGNNTMSISEKQLAIDKLGLILKDKASARDMSSRVQESANASFMSKNIAPVLAFILILTFCIIMVVTGFNLVPNAADSVVLQTVINQITNVVLLVIGFYFGSSNKIK